MGQIVFWIYTSAVIKHISNGTCSLLQFFDQEPYFRVNRLWDFIKIINKFWFNHKLCDLISSPLTRGHLDFFWTHGKFCDPRIPVFALTFPRAASLRGRFSGPGFWWDPQRTWPFLSRGAGRCTERLLVVGLATGAWTGQAWAKEPS